MNVDYVNTRWEVGYVLDSVRQYIGLQPRSRGNGYWQRSLLNYVAVAKLPTKFALWSIGVNERDPGRLITFLGPSAVAIKKRFAPI